MIEYSENIKPTEKGIAVTLQGLHEITASSLDMDTTDEDSKYGDCDCRFDEVILQPDVLFYGKSLTEAQKAEANTICKELQELVLKMYELDKRFHKTFGCM